jgi:hypothetical protein
MKSKWLWVAAGLFCVLVALIGFNLGGASLSPDGPSRPGGSAQPENRVTYSANDFGVELRVKSKRCSGFDGCKVTLGVEPKYLGSGEGPEGVWEVTYEITGDEDGPLTRTFTVEGGRMENLTGDELVSTPSEAVEPSARVVSVQAADGGD